MSFAPRIVGWLPRGRVGYCGVLSSALCVWATCGWTPNVALPTCLVAGTLSLWFALGLRRDGDRGEMTDSVITEEDQIVTEVLLGDVRYSEWRISTAIGVCGGIGMLVAVGKCFF